MFGRLIVAMFPYSGGRDCVTKDPLDAQYTNRLTVSYGICKAKFLFR